MGPASNHQRGDSRRDGPYRTPAEEGPLAAPVGTFAWEDHPSPPSAAWILLLIVLVVIEAGLLAVLATVLALADGERDPQRILDTAPCTALRA